MGKSNTMKTIKELMEQHIPNSAYGHYSNYQIEQMLKEYGTMVVEECKAQAKVEHGLSGRGAWIDENSILRVKDSIK